jgi:AGZA family xanthine/uracil permease-like MFS transporter
MKKTKWFVPGDIDGFFGLLLDNLIQLLVLVGLCIGVIGFPPEFVFGTVLPGASKFGLPEVSLGLIPGFGGNWNWI